MQESRYFGLDHRPEPGDRRPEPNRYRGDDREVLRRPRSEGDGRDALHDGVAGLAILGLAYSFWSYLAVEESRFRRAVLVAGLFAGIASVAQMVIGEVMAYRAAHGASDDSVETLFKVLNNLDT